MKNLNVLKLFAVIFLGLQLSACATTENQQFIYLKSGVATVNDLTADDKKQAQFDFDRCTQLANVYQAGESGREQCMVSRGYNIRAY